VKTITDDTTEEAEDDLYNDDPTLNLSPYPAK
jgi:hypothetical protein